MNDLSIVRNADQRLLGVGLTPAEAALAESLPVTLHRQTYNALFALRIHGRAIVGQHAFDALHLECVCYLPGERFELARGMRDPSGHVLAVVIPCQNEFGEADDLAAWEIESGRVATWRGAAAVLGAHYLGEPWVDDDRFEELSSRLTFEDDLDESLARWTSTREKFAVAVDKTLIDCRRL